MDRDTLIATVVVFLGASVIFNLLGSLTEDSATGLRVVVQLGALALLVGGAMFLVRRRR